MPGRWAAATPITVTERRHGGTGPRTLWLASRSPRRRELLEQIGVAYRLRDVLVDESVRPGEPAARYVQRVARAKAEAGVALGVAADLVLAADTTVVLDRDILGKPADAAEAAGQLRRLSARSHVVLSAVALADGARLRVALNRSVVRFRALAEAEIQAYCAGGEPLDKAGSYAIQGRAAVFVEHLQGSYSGVMGLPLFETAALLRQAGYPR